ncbi:MAG: FAD-dependent oxidoreductase [Solirubrobacteraceae bacterium]
MRRPRVAILGAGMAGIAAAWRLSEPGWQRELESITVYQRGWRLGGKGASSRGPNGRIEEHGLHLWLGYYENSFRLLRECYAELDRVRTDPAAPIRTWREAMLPAGTVGLEDRRLDGWHHWLGQFTPNDLEPGEPEAGAEEFSVRDVLRRALQLITDFLDSLPDEQLPSGVLALSGSPDPPRGPSPVVTGLRVGVLAAILEASAQLGGALDRAGLAASVGALDRAIAATNDALRGLAEEDPDLRRTWHLVAVLTAVVRGMLADGVVTDQQGLRALNDEDFLDWICRHGAPAEVAEFAFIRGLYDLGFAEAGVSRSRRGVSAGVAVFLTTKMFLEYRGSIFWKMAAGMGDVVFAPLYQALSRRGVGFEFFHRVDHLHLSADRTRVDAVTVGRQVDLAQGRVRYDPLVRFGGLPCFPSAPLLDQLDAGAEVLGQPLESHFCDWPDAGVRVLRDGVDYDTLVFAISLGMAPVVCGELIDDRRDWRAMVENVRTTATQAVQVWLREDEQALGWPHPGATVSAYEQPLHTWASMPQLIDLECWPAAERPGAIAYFCGSLRARYPPEGDWRAYVAEHRACVRTNAIELLEQRLPHLLPGISPSGSFRWELLCGRDGHSGPAAIDTQLCVANLDPSDRYVQCAPGSDAHRLRSDESGYDNLVLAGDWTDNGLNAGCIEAATISGLQAANAVLRRSRSYRIAGTLLS